MTYQCAGVDIAPDMMKRVSAAAREWSENPSLTPGQRAMALTLEKEAARLAATAEPAASEVAFVKKMCCHLLAAANGGELPDRSQWPCSPRAAA